jgi:FMN phosphatase YigB (HAD superfamily)
MGFDTHTVAERGRKIYDKHRQRMEADHRGKVVAIDIRSEKVFVGDSPEAAYRAAVQAGMTGPFHFTRVGDRGVYRSTRSPWPRRAAG